MTRDQITALAKGLVPFVREVVTEAVTSLGARIAELEARPTEKGEAGERGAEGPQGPAGPKGDSGELVVVSPELAEQIKSAIHLLHESPPIVKRDDQPVLKWPSPPRVSRIERDENGTFVPIYDDGPQA
jgi:hypothetical protein